MRCLERERLVTSFMAGDLETFVKMVQAVRAKLQPRPDKRKMLRIYGKRGAMARWCK